MIDVAAEQLEAAPDTASSDIDAIVERFKGELCKELQKYLGQIVLTLKHELLSTDVKVAQITVGKQGALNSIVLEWSPKGRPAVQIAVSPTIYKQPGTTGPEPETKRSLVARFGITIVGETVGYSASTLLEVSADRIGLPDNRLFLKLPRPNNTPGYVTYVTYWYRADQAQKRRKQLGEVSGPFVDVVPKWDGTCLTLALPSLGGSSLPATDSGISEMAKAMAPAFILRSIELVMQFAFQERLVVLQGVPQPDKPDDIARALGLPLSATYRPPRPVDLSPAALSEYLEKPPEESKRHPMFFPWHVYEAVCTSLNLGRNLILTGPPGCGKTELAIALARVAAKTGSGAGKEPKVVTASPAWTAGDVIGRYFPRRDGGGLRFQPGVFLQAVAEDRWLIIDELNRADLDQCFGELFTVLAGQAVDLPFEAPIGDDGDHDEAEPASEARRTHAPVRIVPAAVADRTYTDRDRVQKRVSDSFRLLGTMNDADRASLHQLSFALLRRFDVIQIDAPESRVVREQLLRPKVFAAFGIEHSPNQFKFRKNKNVLDVRESLRDALYDQLTRLFCPDAAAGDPALIPDRVVGVSTLLDLIRFVAEGLRSPSGPGDDSTPVVRAEDYRTDKSDEMSKDIVASFMALGLVLTVFPQLDALDDAGFRRACLHVVGGLQGRSFVRIKRDQGPDSGGAKYELKVENHAQSTVEDRDGANPVSVAEFLRMELLKKYRGSPRGEWVYNELLPKSPAS